MRKLNPNFGIKWIRLKLVQKKPLTAALYPLTATMITLLCKTNLK